MDRRDLREFDLHYGAASALQSLLPSRALVTAWSGAFASAYDVLAPSGTQQHNDADREALRWAEIALYAAAAKLPDEAADALRRFAVAFARDGASTQHAARGAILASLAAHLAGAAPEWRCDDPPATGRLGALNRAVATVIARLRGEASADDLLDAFDDLRRHEFAGLAKLFAALPEAAG